MTNWCKHVVTVAEPVCRVDDTSTAFLLAMPGVSRFVSGWTLVIHFLGLISSHAACWDIALRVSLLTML